MGKQRLLGGSRTRRRHEHAPFRLDAHPVGVASHGDLIPVGPEIPVRRQQGDTVCGNLEFHRDFESPAAFGPAPDEIAEIPGARADGRLRTLADQVSQKLHGIDKRALPAPIRADQHVEPVQRDVQMPKTPIVEA